jgi:hypothetical protein
MKKIVILLATLSICLAAGAQEHLKFKNIPLDGPRKDFVSKLEKNEFRVVEVNDAGTAMRGLLAKKMVSAFIMANSEDKVCRIATFFDSHDNWSALKMDFYTLLRSLDFKYGEPVELHQEFQLPFSDGDGREMEALKRGRGRWYARFESAEGTIHMMIANNPVTQEPAIMLLYEDSINCEREDEINATDL